MCFSATASFAMGGLLIPAGAYAVAKARQAGSGWMPFAAYPVMFGIQQIFEGFVWLGLDSGDAEITALSAFGFLLMSHFFWLAWVPLSVWLTETDRARRRMTGILSILGCLYGLSLYLPVIVFPDNLTVAVVNRSIDYSLRLTVDGSFNLAAIRVAYGAIIIGALVLSSDRRIQFFGGLVAGSLLVTYAFYEYAFISVWCFFAAGLSAYLALVIAQNRPGPDSDQATALADNSS